MKTKTKNNTDTSRGAFTLLEILIAISIVVIIGGVVALQLIDMPQKSRRDAASMQLGTFKTAIQIYVADNGFPPSQRQGLEALVAKPTTPPIPANYRPNGYLDSKTVPKDPWGGDYVYLSPGSDGGLFEIICYGSDGDEGGEGYAADLSSATP